MGRLLRFFIAIPLIGVLWAAANSIGVTQSIEKMTGLDVPSGVTIPGLSGLLDTADSVDQASDEVKEKARRHAVKALRAEVRQRYGAETAALVPNDLGTTEARRILARLLDGSLTRASLADALADDLPSQPPATPPGGAPDGPNLDYDLARRQLADLQVRSSGSMAGYDRDEFGSEWDDDAGDFFWTDNGCDSRNDALARDLTQIRYDAGSDCEVASGVLVRERYSGRRWNFLAGSSDLDRSLDIDHVVALGNSWISGSARWSEAKRAALANDPLNLWPVSASLNRQKSDQSAADWLPPNVGFRCAYVSRQIQVKTRYGLTVTTAERQAMNAVLTGCG